MVAPRIRSLIIDKMPQSPVEVLTFGKLGNMLLLESVLIPQDAGDFARILEKSNLRMVGITEATQWNWPGGSWYQNLTVFTFHVSEDWEAHDVINAHDIVQFLSNTLQLKVLDLRGIHTVTTGRPNTNRPITQVALNKLRYIYLRLCTREIIDLVFDYFSLAPNFEVYIGHDYQRGTHNIRDDFQFIDNRLPHSAFVDEPVLDLIVRCHSVFTLQVTSQLDEDLSWLMPVISCTPLSTFRRFSLEIFKPFTSKYSSISQSAMRTVIHFSSWVGSIHFHQFRSSQNNSIIVFSPSISISKFQRFLE
ncbi:hypothetical protein C8Q75DRAFT_786401 [Abortiporus biennis]|nr:hypothetical protein C8Q75DRAFT_786401 [Abortiporus biennis]